MNYELMKDKLISLLKNNDFNSIVNLFTYEDRFIFFDDYISKFFVDNDFKSIIDGNPIDYCNKVCEYFFTEEEAIQIVDDNLLRDSYMILYAIHNNTKRYEYMKRIINTTNVIEEGLLPVILNCIEDDNLKNKAINEYKEYLKDDKILDIIKSISDDMLRLEALKNYLKDVYIIGREITDIILTFNDLTKTSLINEYEKIIEEYSLIRIYCSFDNDHLKQSKIYALKKSLKKDNETNSYISSLIQSINNDSLKLSLLKEFEGYLPFSQIILIIRSINNDSFLKLLLNKYKKELFINNDKIIKTIIQTIHDDQLKIKYFFEFYNMGYYENGKNISDLVSFISSINNVDLKIKFINDLLNLINSNYFISILGNFDDELKCIIIDNNLNNFDSNILYQLISYLPEEKRIEYAIKCKDKLSDNNIVQLLSTNDINVLYEVLSKHEELSDVIKKSLFIIIYNSASEETFYNGLNNNTKNSLFNHVDSIIKLYDNESISLSDLKILIGMQARMNYNLEKKNSFNSYLLPSSLAENLANMTKDKSIGELNLNCDFLKKKFRMINLIDNYYDVEVIANFLKTYSNKKINEEEFLLLLLKKLNIKEMSFGKELKNDLLNEYVFEIKKLLSTNNISISSFYILDKEIDKNTFFYEKAKLLKSIFKNATRNIFEKSLIDSNIKENGLLTQLCTYSLNIERRNFELSEKLKMEKLIKPQLLLTDKGKELIYKKRIEYIIKSDEILSFIFTNSNIEFKDKMSYVFSKWYPNYEGVKDLKILFDLMSNDNRFKSKLLSDLTMDEISSIPFESYYFKINEKTQKMKLFFAIIKAIIRDNVNLGENELNPKIIDRLRIIESNLLQIKDDSKQNIPLLLFDQITSTSSSNIENLCLYYSDMLEHFPPIDLKGNQKEFNIDNLYDYNQKIKNVSHRNSNYYVVLGENVVDNLEEFYLNRNYDFYIDKMSKRTYRTIPSIEGSFKSLDGTYTYSSYEVDDAEQLIAGSRISPTIKRSCFRIGDIQSDTIEYILSSPHGTLIKISDENGNFLGRIYGYRVGNAVHFTRFFYNKEFDFRTAIKRIANDILNKSNEIEYVTCIPFTCTNDEFLSDNILPIFKNIDEVQEGYYLDTDHFEKISIVASKSNDLNDVQFNRNEPKERFYKKRESLNNIKINEEFFFSNDFIKLKKIIYECKVNHNGLINILNKAKYIVYGSDFAIIDFGRKEPLILSVDYDIDESYNQIVSKEIEEAKILLKKMKQDEPTDADTHNM